MIAIINRPYKISGLQKSNWIASHSPIVYELASFLYNIEKSNNQYYIYVDVFEVATNKRLGRMKIAPFFDNLLLQTITVDISSIVRAYLKSDYKTSINKNYKDDTLNIFIRFSEYVLSELKSEYTDEANPLFVVQAVRQFGEVNESNLIDFVPFGTGTPKALFLADQLQPIAYIGYDFSLSFIYSELVAGAQLIRFVEQLDINKNTITTIQTQLDTSQSRAVNFLKIDDISLQPNCEYVNIWLQVGTAIADGYVDAGYVDINYTV